MAAADEFELLLDEAFGIDSTQEDLKYAGTQPQHAEQHLSSSSLDPSPAASPVQMYPSWAPAGSPCLSDASMQMHASPLHDKSSAEQQYDPQLLYSPVRQGSPSLDEGLSPATTFADIHIPAASQQQGNMADQHSQHQQQERVLGSQAGTTPAPQQPGDTVTAHTAAAACSTTQHTRSASFHQHVSLCSLPREVQMRVLCFVSADSLTSLAQTCSQFSSLCNEPVLWRRLFVHRWGKNARHSIAQSWKVRYMERDAAELQAAGAGAQDRDIMQDIFLQAHRAKRHKALGIGAVDDLMLVEDDEVAARVVAWRKSRGFSTLSGPGGGAQPQRPSDLAPPQPRQVAQGHRASADLGAYVAAAAAGAFGSKGKVVKRPVSAVAGSEGPSSNKAPAAASPNGSGTRTQGTDHAAATPGGKAGLNQHVLEAALAAAQDTMSRAASGPAPPPALLAAAGAAVNNRRAPRAVQSAPEARPASQPPAPRRPQHQAAVMAAAALSVCAPFTGTTRPFVAAPVPRASMPARGLVIRAAIVGPGKKWEHMDLNANGKPQRFQMHVRLGDTVKVIAGSDKGTVGTIVALNTKHGMVTVEGVNIKTKHVKPTAQGEEGQILKKEFPVHHSNVAVYSTAQQTHSRVGHKMVDGKKVRFLKKTGEVLPERIPERKPAAADSSE